MKRITLVFLAIIFITQAYAQNVIKRDAYKDKSSAPIISTKTKVVEKNKTDVDDQVELGFKYFFGVEGMPIDKQKGLDYLKKAAAKNNSEAMTFLGDFYSTPNSGIPTDLKAAISWYTKAANLGNSIAMNSLGEMYRDGIGTDIDIPTANKWFVQAALKDEGAAWDNLGKAYAAGIGYEVSPKDAAASFLHACNLGFVPAYIELGDCYVNGFGVNQDYSQALSLYKLASDNLPEANYKMGEIYKTIYQDYQSALEVYNNLLSQGFDVQKEIDEVNALMYKKQQSENVSNSSSTSLSTLTKKEKVISIPINGQKIKMVRVDGGTFIMGSTSDKLPNDNTNNWKPAHQVTLSDYYIGECEVTQAIWQIVMGTNPSLYKGEKLPVENVSWFDCQEFISKLNALTGMKFRLPTEAEWEFAARGGNKTKGYTYSGSNNLNDVGWYAGHIGNYTKGNNVGKLSPNELGIYDMSGNVSEWCQDYYEQYSSESQINPTGPLYGTNRVIRGGCGVPHSAAMDFMCTTYWRVCCDPQTISDGYGLRLVLSE